MLTGDGIGDTVEMILQDDLGGNAVDMFPGLTSFVPCLAQSLQGLARRQPFIGEGDGKMEPVAQSPAEALAARGQRMRRPIQRERATDDQSDRLPFRDQRRYGRKSFGIGSLFNNGQRMGLSKFQFADGDTDPPFAEIEGEDGSPGR